MNEVKINNGNKLVSVGNLCLHKETGTVWIVCFFENIFTYNLVRLDTGENYYEESVVYERFIKAVNKFFKVLEYGTEVTIKVQ